MVYLINKLTVIRYYKKNFAIRQRLCETSITGLFDQMVSSKCTSSDTILISDQSIDWTGFGLWLGEKVEIVGLFSTSSLQMWMNLKRPATSILLNRMESCSQSRMNRLIPAVPAFSTGTCITSSLNFSALIFGIYRFIGDFTSATTRHQRINEYYLGRVSAP